MKMEVKLFSNVLLLVLLAPILEKMEEGSVLTVKLDVPHVFPTVTVLPVLMDIIWSMDTVLKTAQLIPTKFHLVSV